MSLVIINDVEVHLVSRDGSIFANSLEVASVFGKEHAKVIRSIESMSKRGQSNFGVTSYIDGSNRNQKMYEMNRDGFMFLTMGFTGEKAENWKLDLIDAFNEMERQIKEPKILTIPEQIALLAQGTQLIEHKVDEIKNEVELLKNDIVLTPIQKRIIQKSVSTKVYSFEVPKENNAKLFKRIYSKLMDRFAVSSYMEIQRLKFDEAKSMVDSITLIDLV